MHILTPSSLFDLCIWKGAQCGEYFKKYITLMKKIKGSRKSESLNFSIFFQGFLFSEIPKNRDRAVTGAVRAAKTKWIKAQQIGM